MNQRPRLRIEYALLVLLVVFRRVVIDDEQFAQGEKLLFAQRHQMIGNQFAQVDFAILFNGKGAVVLGEPFIKPRGHVANRVINHQVHVLVIDDAEGIVGISLGAQRDVVDVLAFLKVTGRIGKREWFVRTLALEYEHGRGNGRGEFRSAEQAREDIAKLL